MSVLSIPKLRYRNMAELIGIFDTILRRNPVTNGARFSTPNLIWGPVMGLHEVPQDTHPELGMFPPLSIRSLGPIQP